LLVSVAVASTAIFAQEPIFAAPTAAEIKEARALFQAGLALEAAGDYKNALTKFHEVAAVRPTPQVMFHVALCLEHLGRWTEALGTYRITIDRALEEAAEDVVENADQARQKLEQRMPRLKILRSESMAGAVVHLDGVLIGAASFGVEMPSDPGEHRVVVTVDGKEVFTQVVSLEEGRVETVTITKQTPKAPPPLAPAPKPSPEPNPIAPSQRIGYYFLGGGITSLVIGGMFVKLRNDTIDRLETQCAGNHCPASLESTSDRGKIYMMAANGFVGAGLLSAGIGTVILLQRHETEPAPQSAHTQVGLSAGGPLGAPGATVWGNF